MPAPFLVQVEQHAAALLGDPLHRRVELRAAVAARRVEHVAGQAARVHAHQHVLAVADVSLDQRDVGLAIDEALVGDDAELAVLGRQRRRRDAPDQRLGPHPVLDQIGDRDHQQLVPLRELRQLRHARHRAVLVHDFADDAGRIQTRRSARDRPPPRSARRAPARRRCAPSAGNMWPGRARSDGRVRGSIAASTVAARSAAEMPVLVTPFASIGHGERRVELRGVLRDHLRHVELRRAALRSSACRSARGRAWP